MSAIVAALILLYRAALVTWQLERHWDAAITGKMIFRRQGDDLRLVKANPKGLEISGHQLRVGDLLCRQMPSHREPVYPYNQPLIALYMDALKAGTPRQIEFRYEGGEVQGWFLNLLVPLGRNTLYMTFLDITELKEAAFSDSATGLYNRRFLGCYPTECQSCIWLDLDDFKLINDTWGHDAADDVLASLAQKLQAIAKEKRGVAVRNGGDEFLVMLPDGVNPGEVALSVLHQARTISIGDNYSIDVSIGVACHPIELTTLGGPSTHLRQAAEMACKEAKDKKGSQLANDRIQFWTEDLARQKIRHQRIEAGLRRNQLERELSVVYQPIFDLSTGRIFGAEALIRWNSSLLGVISPSEFIPVAEVTGAIRHISEWVTQRALEQATRWTAINPDFLISVNISPEELEEGHYAAQLLNTIKRIGLSPKNVGLEITERGIYRNQAQYANAIKDLRDCQICLIVDDFGTGRSGLANLDFHFDEVKVDRSLLMQDPSDEPHYAICSAIASIAQTMKFKLVAEGIEHQHQLDVLRDLGYELGQGFLLSHPVSASELTKLLQKECHESLC
ncbi:MAG: GGDEF domain-containing phosphodiesterase [Cyanobacteria bacterium]|nr:GGDEF domain-containing phosphodiesterase [Cyanobacteriota bacterium]